jgi:hypothetical protein
MAAADPTGDGDVGRAAMSVVDTAAARGTGEGEPERAAMPCIDTTVARGACGGVLERTVVSVVGCDMTVARGARVLPEHTVMS